MKPRHESRLHAVQFLYQHDFNRQSVNEALEAFWSRSEASEKCRPFAEELIRGVIEHREEIDGHIAACAEHWEMKRIAAVDRNIMRTAIYEMLYCPSIPPVVSINEAVDLAKEFNSYKSGKFVNGILDAVRQGLDRPPRTARPASWRATGSA